MRRGIPIALTLLLALPASAEGWKNMYLADTGGSRLIRVDPSESQQVDAYVAQSDGDMVAGAGGGLILAVSCERIRLANGDPFLGSEVEVIASFDGGEQVKLGRFGYAGGAYWATYRSEIMSAFRSHESLSVAVPSHDKTFVFSLKGFEEAFDRIECFTGATP